jgi:hypothetical protein
MEIASARSGVLQRLTICLRQSQPEHMPNWVRDQIDVNLADNAQRFERIKQTYARVAQETASARRRARRPQGIFALARIRRAPSSSSTKRTSISSVLTNPFFLTRAALTKLDYKPEESDYHLPMDHLAPMIPRKPVQWRGNPYDPEMEVSFELHFQFWNPRRSRLYPAGLEDFWARRVRRSLDDITFSGLCDVDNIGYAALNLLRDLLGGIPDTVKVYEIARFLHTTCDDEMFWHRWRECHDPSLRRLEAVCFQLASTWFANRVPPQVEEEIERLPAIVKSWFAQRADAPLLQRPPLYRDNLWLHVGLLGATKDKAAIFVRGLVPVPPPADALYVLAAALKTGEWPKTTWRKYTNYFPMPPAARFLGRRCCRLRLDAA